MAKCKKCNSEIKQGSALGCRGCDTVFCENCAEQTHRICPNCYSDLEYIG